MAQKYTILGITYFILKSATGFIQSGIASWYGPGFHGKKMANGKIYDMHKMTAAHKTLPLGTKVRVTLANTDNQAIKSVIVEITDRGPFKPGRIIDLSKAAAQQLGIEHDGTAKVHIKALTS